LHKKNNKMMENSNESGKRRENVVLTICKKAIEKQLDKLLRHSKSFRNYVDFHFNRDGCAIIPLNLEEGLTINCKGLKFSVCSQLNTINAVTTDYRFSDIKKSDVCLDIGANIGAFSILASKAAKHVYAVEPLFVDILRANIKINGISNIDVLEVAVGDGDEESVNFSGRTKRITHIPLSDILGDIGHCDFLKIDCEGCEWTLDYKDLENFRRIEGELHNFDGKHDFKLFERNLNRAGFSYTVDKRSNSVWIIHAIKEMIK